MAEAATAIREFVGHPHRRPWLDVTLNEATSFQLLETRRKYLGTQARSGVTQFTKATWPCLQRREYQRAPRTPENIGGELESVTLAVDRFGHQFSLASYFPKESRYSKESRLTEETAAARSGWATREPGPARRPRLT